jgi:hypothetical protein
MAGVAEENCHQGDAPGMGRVVEDDLGRGQVRAAARSTRACANGVGPLLCHLAEGLEVVLRRIHVERAPLALQPPHE